MMDNMEKTAKLDKEEIIKRMVRTFEWDTSDIADAIPYEPEHIQL